MTTLGAADRTAVRRCLTSRTGLMEAARLWLRRARPDISRDITDLVVLCIGEGAEDEDALGLQRVSDRTARRYLSAANLPAPVQLRAIGRLLPPLLALQADPSLRLEDVARPGFSSAAGLRMAVRRALGVGVAGVRNRWGVEAILSLCIASFGGNRIARF